jgi:hypothetical protein
MNFMASLFLSATLLAATVVAIPLPGNADTALSHNNDNAGNADEHNSVFHGERKSERRLPMELLMKLWPAVTPTKNLTATDGQNRIKMKFLERLLLSRL